MKNKITIRGIRDGAMMTALTVIFMLLSLYVPVFSYVGMFLSGIPLAALYARDGFYTSVCATICSLFITFAITGDFISVFFLTIAFAVPGLVAGICLKKGFNFFNSIICTGAAFLFGLIVEILIIKLFMGEINDVFTGLLNGAQVTLEEALSVLADKNSDIDVKQVSKTLLDTFIYTAKLYLPAILIVSSLFSAYLMYIFTGFILKRLKLSKVNIIPFYMMRAPKSMSTAAVVLYIINFFLKPDGVVSAAFYNIIFIIYTFVGFCGFSFLDYKFKSVVKKGFLRILVYALVFLFGGVFLTLIINACIIIGILDSSMNFRRISAIDEENI